MQKEREREKQNETKKTDSAEIQEGNLHSMPEC